MIGIMREVCACRWGEISGKHIELAIGDICDWEFFGEAFKCAAACLPARCTDNLALCKRGHLPALQPV